MLIQWNDEGNVYVVTISEFPSHRTQGTSWEDAAKNGSVLLGQILESGGQTATKRKIIDRPQTDRCSFCDKPRDQVERLTEGPGDVNICNECVDICREVIEEGLGFNDMRLELAKRNPRPEKLEEIRRDPKRT